ncbi:VIL1 protein [Gonium pectorale]|uniref:VIL1 protein n=1 Tax=Gonium pectorale TaxID=33097 RepID=A0A150GPX8_GONPE|nr:VIL1 protein [Gonium pectorale]|eukprot:KXZ51854.1 VIL1 protein [Gonium pectorale]
MVISRHLSVHNCVELLAVVGGRGRAEAPALAEVAEGALRYAANSFETLQALRSEEELRAVLPEEMYESLAAAAAERAAIVADRRAVLGKVKERAAPPEGSAAPVERPSVAGRPLCYPPGALQSGMAWPPGIEGDRREEWLGEEDFVRLFGGMGWQQFAALPGWRKERMRKAAGLF